MTIRTAPGLTRQLLILTLGRLLQSSALRLTYPFLPAFARGLGVPLQAVTQLVALRAFAGFLSPILAPLAERFGRRASLAGSMLVFGLALLLLLVWPAYWALAVALIAIGVTKVVYDPALQAYLGDTVPYRQRGVALALSETSWAGAMLLGAPLAGFLIARQGWAAPFVWLGFLSLPMAWLIWKQMPAGDGGVARIPLSALPRVFRRHRVIWFAALYMLLIMAANELFFIVYGGWMEEQFGLGLASLGLATAVLGGAEIAGELAAGVAVDRFGKRPVIITTGALTGLAYLLVPYTSRSLALALITLFFVFLVFEITVVGGVPLMTEVVPSARTVVLSIVLAAGSLGRMLGALAGPFLWQRSGMGGNMLVAGLVMWLAVVLLAGRVRENAAGRGA
ncbi:MAG: MFS transporter [Chloroflexi bacterium]|nr:MFS transporter [Chloroflexota bacterium]